MSDTKLLERLLRRDDRGPRTAPTVVLVLLCTSTALPQHSIIEHCRDTSSDADRITCLEAALLGRERLIDTSTRTQVDPPSLEPDAGPAADAVEPVPNAAPVGIGADQVIARDQTREDMIEQLEEARGLLVASYDQVPYERLVVTLENGQVWRQIKGDTQRIRVDLKRNQTVDITESSISGYKLRLNEMRRTIRVERVK